MYDGLGSVVGEVDPSGNLTSSGTFDVYGAKRVGGTGTATSRQGFVGGLGHVSDAETGLVYMRARYYDPNVGRFVSEDPGKNGMNWFIYANNNPIRFFDFDGRSTLETLLDDNKSLTSLSIAVTFAMGALFVAENVKNVAAQVAVVGLSLAAAYEFAVAFGASPGLGLVFAVGGELGGIIGAYMTGSAALMDAAYATGVGAAAIVVASATLYGLAVLGASVFDP